MRATPNPTCTRIATSTMPVKIHKALYRSCGYLCAASAHAPARPLPPMTTQAQSLWTSNRRDAISRERLLPGAAGDLVRPELARHRDRRAGRRLALGTRLVGLVALAERGAA